MRTAIFWFLFWTGKWVESFQSYVDNSKGMSKIPVEIARSRLQNVTP